MTLILGIYRKILIILYLQFNNRHFLVKSIKVRPKWAALTPVLSEWLPAIFVLTGVLHFIPWIQALYLNYSMISAYISTSVSLVHISGLSLLIH